MTLYTLFLLFCISFSLAMKRQRATVFAHNGRSVTLSRESEWSFRPLDLRMDAQQVFGHIVASMTRFASKLFSWVVSLAKRGPKGDGLKPTTQPHEDKVEDETLIQHFQTYLFGCRLRGLSDSSALEKLHVRFPLHGDLIQTAFEKFAGRPDPEN